MKNSTVTAPNFFNEDSPFLQHPLLTTERTSLEVDFIETHMDLEPGARVLDIGCGFGRHCIELARRGYKVTGIDPSAILLGEARKRAAEKGVNVDFRREWGEKFIIAHSFDAAICLFTTLGQSSDRGENSALVESTWSVLKPGGYFLVEVPQRETAVFNLIPNEEFGAGEQVTSISRDYHEKKHTITEVFRVVKKNQEKSFLLRYKLFDRDELETTLRKARFTNLEAFGDYNGIRLTAEHDIMLLLAQKVR